MADNDDTNAPRQSEVGHTPLPPLPQDNDSPFSPATNPSTDATVDTDVQIAEATLDSTHQVTDTNIEQEEVYDEGLSGAAEASEPNAGDAVADYNPKHDTEEKT